MVEGGRGKGGKQGARALVYVLLSHSHSLTHPPTHPLSVVASAWFFFYGAHGDSACGWRGVRSCACADTEHGAGRARRPASRRSCGAPKIQIDLNLWRRFWAGGGAGPDPLLAAISKNRGRGSSAGPAIALAAGFCSENGVRRPSVPYYPPLCSTFLSLPIRIESAGSFILTAGRPAPWEPAAGRLLRAVGVESAALIMAMECGTGSLRGVSVAPPPLPPPPPPVLESQRAAHAARRHRHMYTIHRPPPRLASPT